MRSASLSWGAQNRPQNTAVLIMGAKIIPLFLGNLHIGVAFRFSSRRPKGMRGSGLSGLPWTSNSLKPNTGFRESWLYPGGPSLMIPTFGPRSIKQVPTLAYVDPKG